MCCRAGAGLIGPTGFRFDGQIVSRVRGKRVATQTVRREARRSGLRHRPRPAVPAGAFFSWRICANCRQDTRPAKSPPMRPMPSRDASGDLRPSTRSKISSRASHLRTGIARSIGEARSATRSGKSSPLLMGRWSNSPTRSWRQRRVPQPGCQSESTRLPVHRAAACKPNEFTGQQSSRPAGLFFGQLAPRRQSDHETIGGSGADRYETKQGSVS